MCESQSVLKVVIDTNNFVSSLINKRGLSAQLIDFWRHGYYTLVISDEILEEIQRVLTYPKIFKKYNLCKTDIKQFIYTLTEEATILPVASQVNIVKEDPDDNKFLACAIDAQADYIISGDQHLLKLKKYQSIPILTVREFLELLKKMPK